MSVYTPIVFNYLIQGYNTWCYDISQILFTVMRDIIDINPQKFSQNNMKQTAGP